MSVLKESATVLYPDGTHSLDENESNKWEQTIQELESKNLETIGFATDNGAGEKEWKKKLLFLGIIGLQ